MGIHFVGLRHRQARHHVAPSAGYISIKPPDEKDILPQGRDDFAVGDADARPIRKLKHRAFGVDMRKHPIV